jgi:hypothetical protein
MIADDRKRKAKDAAKGKNVDIIYVKVCVDNTRGHYSV